MKILADQAWCAAQAMAMVATASQVLIALRRCRASSTVSVEQGIDEHRELARLVGVHAAIDKMFRQPAAKDRTDRGDGINDHDGERPTDDAGDVGYEGRQITLEVDPGDKCPNRFACAPELVMYSSILRRFSPARKAGSQKRKTTRWDRS
ncbi:MAG: hypothetical protein U1F83_04745 [Verrucomicrobiota bacterium]